MSPVCRIISFVILIQVSPNSVSHYDQKQETVQTVIKNLFFIQRLFQHVLQVNLHIRLMAVPPKV